ncbi:MAG: AzlD domain-containing protein [Anaerolineales bacterium]|nr:AzlD domain-containing protein [Anaerolineales bacterium]MCW5854880.1 AzlD domain-containing protein [Anaerolineales bacterium]
MNEVLLIASMAAATIATRIPILLLLSRRQLPQGLFAALRYVPAAVLSAIIVPMVLTPGGELNLSWQNAALLASLVAALVSWRTRNLLLTIVVGMTVFLAWRAFF